MSDQTAAATPAVRWGHERLTFELAVDAEGAPRVTRLGPPEGPAPTPGAALPPVEIRLLGEGSEWSGRRGVETTVGGRLRLRAHSRERDGDWHRLRIELHDAATGLTAELLLESPEGRSVVRSRVRVTNEGPAPLTLLDVPALCLGGLPSADDLDLWWADNDWLAEARWATQPLRERLPDLNFGLHARDGRNRVGYASRGSWSTDGHLAMGALTARGAGVGAGAGLDTRVRAGVRARSGAGVGAGPRAGLDAGAAWLWQLESATGWLWEVGERGTGTYLALHGPTDAEHQWREPLAPGASFTTVPVALAFSPAGLTGAIAELTAYRRALRRPHPDHRTLPIIFNDYMNTLMGDPTTERLLPLVDAAGAVGAEYFVIDAGWYDDDADGWWDTVGAWQPAASRFPGERGIHQVLDRIRERGMVPGLWLEPEVVGVRSPLAALLPDEAFFQRDGIRVREHGRYHLDLRHPAAVRHLDETVDRLVTDWDVGYLKLDYNISVPPGTDRGRREAPGAGLLGHTRAYQRWLESVLDRHPGLVIENCASGGMRMDGAMLRITQLQSTSDQRDHLRYPPIAAAAPTVAPPEQCAVWAYAQPEFSDRVNDFVLANALLGRVHLSGHLDRMDEAGLDRVRQALDVYREIRAEVAEGTPNWPLGLPGWDDPWLALGLRTADSTLVTVWRRGGAETGTVPVPEYAGRQARVTVLFPRTPNGAAPEARWDAEPGRLTVTLPEQPGAVLLRISPN
ncbi:MULTISPECIES: glycoside hydrolase family 36 protein [Streptomyces]|uniref:glycoside hydrolase family 36 protein n=1 Tax=Streptomyces TaxID=1883 RepID=UPI00186AD9C4|nr:MULTISPECIES: glycoside hydrolase family 36 protein [Streptomyces]